MDNQNKLNEVFCEIQCCSLCKFNPITDVRYLGGRGTDYRIMFIAESPSTKGGTGLKNPNDNFFNTANGLKYKEFLSKFNLENSYFTDIVKCGRKAKKPSLSQINNCIKFLEREIEIIQPKAIVTIGKSLMLSNNQTIPSFPDFISKRLRITVPVFYTWHFSYMRRMGHEISILKKYELQHINVKLFLERC